MPNVVHRLDKHWAISMAWPLDPVVDLAPSNAAAIGCDASTRTNDSALKMWVTLYELGLKELPAEDVEQDVRSRARVSSLSV